MPPNPSTLIAPVTSAFPKYAGVLNSLAALIAADASVATAPPPTTPPPAPPPPVEPQQPGAVSVIAGRPVLLTGDGTVNQFNFGDPSAPFNALRGYNAAHVYDTPGAFVATVTNAAQKTTTTHVTVTADTRPIITLTATDDLAAAFSHITAPTIVQLPAGATYDMKAPIAISVNGITLRAVPSSSTAASATAPRIRRLAAAGVYSTLVIGAADICIQGISFDSDQPLKPSGNSKVGIYALNIMGQNLLVRGCTFRNIDDALHCQAKARGLVAIDCQFTNELRSCAAYLDAMQDVTLLGCTAAGSICEHIFRLEGSQNVLIDGCDLDNKDGKETVAIRMGDNVSVTNNTLRAWARISQGVQAQPGVYCKNVFFSANHFTGLRPDGPWMQINPGSQSVVFDANVFDVDTNQVAIAIQAPVSGVSLTNNRLAPVNGATTVRPLVDPFGNPQFAETGTVK